ncbi:hypothetical protein PRIC1_000991 [Phytophthora ramorum]
MGGRRKMLLASGLVLLVAALLSVPTSAECPNGCSGNGACMAKDMCNCYKNYQGNDCLDRTCQFGYAHADTPKGDINMDQSRVTPSWILTDSQQDPAGTYEYFNPDAATSEAHFYMECANKGLCDRTLGVCTCFDGYEGGACQRSACPNKCTGHGTCESLRELGLKTPGTLFGNPVSPATVTYDLWDSRVSYGCRCDPWYHGTDCSLRSCKVGVDPMFLSAGSNTNEVFALHVWLDATAYPTSAARATNANDYVRLRLFDYHGEAYITDAIPIISDASALTALLQKADAITNAAAVAAAIKKIPNQTFRSVLCEPTSSFTGTDLVGYLSTRTATTHGLSVVCQFTQNPGRLRVPEIATFNFDSVVDTSKKTAKLYRMEKGMDSEWFTEVSQVTVTSGSGLSLTVSNSGGLTQPTPTLFKLGSHVVLGTIASTTITLIYSLKHALASNAPRFDAPTGSGLAVSAAIASTAAINVGDTTITVGTTAPAVVAGDLIFFENKFFTVKSIIAPVSPATAYQVELDTPFGGNSADGTLSASGANFYKITPPAEAFQYKYVSQCSGRGLCTTETGVCACFKGYTNDNCDTQNILAL